MSDLVITGGAGYVGMNLTEYFAQRKNVKIIDMIPPKLSMLKDLWTQVDITDEIRVLSTIQAIQPKCVIHAAGIKDVRYCEAHPDEAYQVNSIGTRNVAQACKVVGAKMIYISTDWVFAGDTGYYQEVDIPNPRNIYGKTKLMGEKLATDILNDLAICRSGGIYGRRSPLLCWARQQLVAGRIIDCFTDVYNSPTYVNNLADHLTSIIDRDLIGTFHIVGNQRVNRYQFFTAFAKIFDFDDNLLKATTINGQGSDLLLLRDCSLAIDRTVLMLGGSFNSLDDGLRLLRNLGGVLCND